MKNTFLLIGLLCIFFISCENDDDAINIQVENPPTYAFERNGASTVSFSGQTIRIGMSEELVSAMKDFNSTTTHLLEMFRNETENGSEADPFQDVDLNASTKSIKSKVAASKDLFSSNTAQSALIKADFETWIMAQVEEVFPKRNELASPGEAGQIADGTSARYVNGKGLEYDQAVNKALIGALMLDQIANNYLSPAVLDEGDNQIENDNKGLVDGKNYTNMEHKWDEAYGYLFGASPRPAAPITSLGNDDSFFNKYLARVNNDPDFAGIADDIFHAFKLGRAAIVAGDYELRDEQAEKIKASLSKVVAIRAVYYLQQGKNAIPVDGDPNKYGTAFHDLSEGFGFIYSLQFTRRPNSTETYFTKVEVDGFLEDLMANKGFWEVSPQTLDAISNAISDKFDFSKTQAAE